MWPNGVFLRSVFLKSLRDQRKAILGWGLGLAGLAYLVMLLYPAISADKQFDLLLQQMPQLKGFFGDIISFTSLEGYVTSQLLSYMPAILSIYLVLAAVGTITGEIESGTMDFLLAHPVPRWKAALEKYAALVAALLLICLLVGLGLWLGGLTIGQDVPFGTWMLAALNLAPLTLFYGSLAFVLACALRGRGIPVGVAVGLAILGFILNGLAPVVEDLKRYREWTIYYLFTAGKPFSTGLEWGYIAILLAASVVCLALALVAFNRKDILA